MWDDLARLDVSHGFERQGIATVYADGRNSFDPPGYREHLTLNVPCTANTAWQVGACSQETDP